MTRPKFVFLFALLFAGGLSLFASAFPDGLESVAHQLGFANLAKSNSLTLYNDYSFANVTHQPWLSGLPKMIGVLLVFGLSFGMMRLLLQSRAPKINKQV
jgi:hypothetical protein